MASVLVPVLYVIIVFGGLFIFSSFYRKREANKLVDPYFPSHPARDTYVTLLQKTDPPTPDAVLKSALVHRAMADVTRVLRLREDKPALQALLQKGSVGDDFWNSLLAAEKEMEAEIVEVVAEANTFVEGWGQIIFETASQVIANEKMRSTFETTPQLRAEAEATYGPNPRPKISTLEPPTSTLSGPPTPNLLSPNVASSISPFKSPVNSPLKTAARLPTGNGLQPPHGVDGVLSDTESVASSTAGNPSKKKNKKRK